VVIGSRLYVLGGHSPTEERQATGDGVGGGWGGVDDESVDGLALVESIALDSILLARNEAESRGGVREEERGAWGWRQEPPMLTGRESLSLSRSLALALALSLSLCLYPISSFSLCLCPLSLSLSLSLSLYLSLSLALEHNRTIFFLKNHTYYKFIFLFIIFNFSNFDVQFFICQFF
jgi:hypothetical protein